MKRKALVAFLASAMVLSSFPVTAFAEEVSEASEIVAVAAGVDNFVGSDEKYVEGYTWIQEGQLSSQDGSKDKNLGNGWNNYAKNILLDAAMGDNDVYRVWKVEIDGGMPKEEAHFYFYNDKTQEKIELPITNFDKSGNGATCLVVTPDGWRLVGGCLKDCAGIKVNYAGRHDAGVQFGTVNVKAAVDAWHNEITPHEYYDRTVDEYYDRTVDEYYERTVDEYYERTVDKFYERPVFNFYERNVDEYYERDVNEYYTRPVTDIYQRYATKFFVPVFEKKLEGIYDDTLVTRLEYSDNTANAKPVNGGAFKNGHTYVTVDVAEASKEGGVNYTIADSSKNNGKKTPDQYNRPIAYTYNVKIADGKLTITFPDDLAYASVGAMVWDKAPKDAKNAPKHYENTVTVDVPKNDGTVDLYFHLEKLGWYDVDEEGNPIYVFKEWKYDHTEEGRDWVYVESKYGEYELVDTVKGDWEKVDTVYGEYELVKTTYGEYVLKDTVNGNYELVNKEIGDWSLVNTVKGEYVKDETKTVYGDYVLIGTDRTGKRVEDNYTGTLTLTVDGEAAEFGELTLAEGEHTFVLSGEGFTDVIKTVTIAAGENECVELKAEVRGEDVTLDVDKVYSDRDATPHYADMEAVRHEKDNVEKHYADKTAEEHYADGKVDDNYADRTAVVHAEERAAEKHYADGEVTEEKKPEFIYHPDVKLGSETDPDGEYAVKLN